MESRRGIRARLFHIALIAALVHCLAALAAACAPKTAGGGNEDAPAIGSAYWGHWTDAGDGGEWYVSDQTVTDPEGRVLSVQAADASSIVVYSGSTQYRLSVDATGLLAVTGSVSGYTRLFKRNGSDASFTASLLSKTGSRILIPAANISLVLQNALNPSNAIPATSSPAGAVVVPPQAIAGDDYLVYSGTASQPVGEIHVAAPDEEAGAIALPPPSLGYTFKASIKGADPLDFRYPDGIARSVTLVIQNTGIADATGLAYSLSSSDPANFSVAQAGGVGLSGSGLALAKGATIEIPLNVSLGAGAGFAAAGSLRDFIEPAVEVQIDAGGETWNDRASVRYYRERRWLRVYAFYAIRGLVRSPDGVSIYFDGQPTDGSATLLELPYRSEPYEAFFFPNYSNPSTDLWKSVYGVRLSSGQTEPSSAEPAPYFAAEAQGNMAIYVGPSYGGGSGFPERWYQYYGLNDGNEPNETVGSGPTVYAGGCFHGYLAEGDYDAYTIDFSRTDPLAGTATADDDFALLYPGIVNDDPLSWTSLESNDGDGRLEPGETDLILLSLKTYLDPTTLTGWTAWIYAELGSGKPTLSGYPASGGSPQFGVNASGPVDLKRFFAHAETENALAATPLVYAQDRPVGLYLWVPSSFAGSSTTLTLRIYDASSTLHGSYVCAVPIAR